MPSSFDNDILILYTLLPPPPLLLLLLEVVKSLVGEAKIW